MQVIITQINGDVNCDEQKQGFWATFSCSLATGPAIIIGDKNKFSIGEAINVETSFDRISNWTILPQNSSRRIVPLSNRGDYQVIGKVDTKCEDGMVCVDAGFTFMVDSGLDTAPDKDQWVIFNVHG